MTNTHYTVLARKYRPAKLSGLIGQDVLVRTLTNAIEQDRIPHAFIMTGIRGVGKTSTARIIARSLVCVGADGLGSKPTIDPCGVCEQCRAIAEDRHVDILEMDAASRTGVDNMREIIESAHYHPVTARYKITIIDEVHMLSKSAFNALLKTLEEPPSHIKFIFATTEIRKIPVTILSRCMRFDLARVDVETLVKHFAGIVEKEGVKVETDALVLIAHASEGSVRDGLSLLDQAIGVTAKGEVVTRDAVAGMLGLVGRGKVFDLFEAIAGGQPRAALDKLKDLYQNGAEPQMVLQDMLELAHFLTQMKLVPEMATAEHIPQADRERGKSLADKLGFPYLARVWQMLLKGIQEVQQAPSALMAAEMVLVRLAYVSDLPPPGDLVKDIKKGGTTTAQAAHQAVKSPAEVVPVARREREEVSAANPKNFSELVALFHLKNEDFIGSHLQEVGLVAFDAELRKVEFSPSPTTPSNLAGKVGGMLSEWTGTRWVAVVSSKQAQPSLRQAAEAARERTRQQALQSEEVQSLLAVFPGARVVEYLDMETVDAERQSGEKQ